MDMELAISLRSTRPRTMSATCTMTTTPTSLRMLTTSMRRPMATGRTMTLARRWTKARALVAG